MTDRPTALRCNCGRRTRNPDRICTSCFGNYSNRELALTGGRWVRDGLLLRWEETR